MNAVRGQMVRLTFRASGVDRASTAWFTWRMALTSRWCFVGGHNAIQPGDLYLADANCGAICAECASGQHVSEVSP